jgi:hypothetical protein
MPRCLLLAFCLLGAAGPAAGQTTIPIDVHKAYLHLDPADIADDAFPIALASLGLAPGYTISLETAGDWHAGPGGDTQTGLLGVFSNGDVLLGPTLPNRVPGALDAGLYNFSGGTWPNNQPTDIPYDFHFLRPGITIVIPSGATHLFVTPADIYYRDNSDPDADLGVTITLVSAVSVPPGAPASPRLMLTAQPNPFAAETSIAFHLEAAATMRLTIHDVTGRLVRTLLAGTLAAGDHRMSWDGNDAAGRRVPAGSYFVRLADAGRVETARLSRVH